MRLILRLTVVILLASAPCPAEGTELITVAMETQGIGEQNYEELSILGLQRKLALRLTQAGFAVVAPHMRPRIRLVFAVHEGRITITVREGTPEEVRPVQREQEDLESYHLEVMHKAVGMTRQVAKELPPLPPPPEPDPEQPPEKLPPVEQNPWLWELALGASALYRLDGTDPLIQAGLRLGLDDGPGLRGSLGISPSSQGSLSVQEVSLQLGGSWRFSLLPRTLHLEAALLVGFLGHVYQLESTDEQGARWDFLASLSLEFGYQIRDYLGVRLFLAPGLSEQSRSHQLHGQELWRRSLFRLDAGLALVIRLI